VKAVAHVGSSTVAGVAAGALLGLAGAQVGSTALTVIATLFGCVALAIACIELSGRRVPVVQRDVETPQRWLHSGPLRWALVNGGTLGFGATSRLGFWLWYAVPAGSLLSADPALGAAIYGTYGFVRGIASVALVVRGWGGGLDRIALRLLALSRPARRLAAADLAVVGAAFMVGAGIYGI
jgi:hypothetical protein